MGLNKNMNLDDGISVPTLRSGRPAPLPSQAPSTSYILHWGTYRYSTLNTLNALHEENFRLGSALISSLGSGSALLSPLGAGSANVTESGSWLRLIKEDKYSCRIICPNIYFTCKVRSGLNGSGFMARAGVLKNAFSAGKRTRIRITVYVPI